MKKIFCSFLMALVTLSFLVNAHAAGKARVEVLYMNHGPLMETLTQLKKLFSGYGDRIAVTWYDFDTKEGEEFMAKKGVRQHVPIVIWMDNQVKFRVEDKDIIFAGFPTGSGPQFFQGKWTTADLQKVLDQLTAKK